MKAADLDILLQEGEGAMLEYKEGLSSSFARELVAFANTVGGRILLGVRDDGTVKGIADTNELRARIQDIARNCDPPVKILLQPIGEVTVVHGPRERREACAVQRRLLLAAGRGDAKALAARRSATSSAAEGPSASISPSARASAIPQDFDREKYNAWLRFSGITGRPRTEDVLVNIEAAERSGGKFLFRNAGVLFFARNARHFFNQAYITCLLAKGTRQGPRPGPQGFRRRHCRRHRGRLRFIERNTRTAYRIEKLQREDIPEYPMKALREAITNAVMHRDWFIEGANVFVEIYDRPHRGCQPRRPAQGHDCSPIWAGRACAATPLIADLLHRIDFIEKAGTGIRRMREGAQRSRIPRTRVFCRLVSSPRVFRPIACGDEHDERP